MKEDQGLWFLCKMLEEVSMLVYIDHHLCPVQKCYSRQPEQVQ